MRFLKAFIIASFMSVASLIPGAVFLGVLNIYLSGHGIDWPNQNFESGFVSMSPLSLALAVIFFATFAIAFGATMYISRNKDQ